MNALLEWKYVNSDHDSTEDCPKRPMKNVPALVQMMAWRRPGRKPLFEPMMA